MRDLISLKDILIELNTTLKLTATQLNNKCMLFEDKTGAKKLSRMAEYCPKTK